MQAVVASLINDRLRILIVKKILIMKKIVLVILTFLKKTKTKAILLFLLLTTLTTIIYGQEVQFDFKNLNFKGRNFPITKDSVIKTFGKPRIAFRDMTCGDGEPQELYYQLLYSNFSFISSDKDRFFILERVDFDLKGKIKLNYGDKVLSGRTTKSEFITIFGDSAKIYFENHPDYNSIILYPKDSDDGAEFIFKDGMLLCFCHYFLIC
jgi:hypothetical protein